MIVKITGDAVHSLGPAGPPKRTDEEIEVAKSQRDALLVTLGNEGTMPKHRLTIDLSERGAKLGKTFLSMVPQELTGSANFHLWRKEIQETYITASLQGQKNFPAWMPVRPSWLCPLIQSLAP